MNNYSWLQQKMHQIALSSKFMREATFDIENSFISNMKTNDDHVFVSGLARSGTTILLNALYQSEEFASLTYNDMPFVLAPNIWSKFSFNKQSINKVERAHSDGIRVSSESPEAFEEVFWMTFDKSDKETKEKFKRYVRLINNRYQKKRYLSKNNQNIKKLDLIAEIFPKSIILITYRHPIQHAYSLLSQHQRFIKYSEKDTFIAKYMKWIGHTEFGPNYIPINMKNLRFEDNSHINHWVEQWYLTYSNSFKDYKNKKNFHFICYEKLCSSKKYWSDILKKLGIKKFYDFEFSESYKEISLEIDESITSQALSIYSQLS